MGTSGSFPVEIAVRNICAQHRSLGRVLRAGEAHASTVVAGQCSPDFRLFGAMFQYIRAFCYGVHHDAEENFLFPAMRASGAPSLVVDKAMITHTAGKKKFAAMQSTLDAWWGEPAMRRPVFLELLPDFIAFENEHMSYEETVLLPFAVDTLQAGQWLPIADAFRAQDDPLFGPVPAPELAPLHHLLTAGAA